MFRLIMRFAPTWVRDRYLYFIIKRGIKKGYWEKTDA
jgi:hypothetical protein